MYQFYKIYYDFSLFDIVQLIMGKIKIWKRSPRVTVYPHLELDQGDYSQKKCVNLLKI